MKTISITRDEAELLVDLLESGPQQTRHIELSDQIRHEFGMAARPGNEERRLSARLALSLIRVLSWETPTGTLWQSHLPGNVLAKIHPLLRRVPREDMEAIIKREPDWWPESLLVRWYSDVPGERQ